MVTIDLRQPRGKIHTCLHTPYTHMCTHIYMPHTHTQVHTTHTYLHTTHTSTYHTHLHTTHTSTRHTHIYTPHTSTHHTHIYTPHTHLHTTHTHIYTPHTSPVIPQAACILNAMLSTAGGSGGWEGATVRCLLNHSRHRSCMPYMYVPRS